MPITLQESPRGLLYAPYYAALALGVYRSEGVEVDLVSAQTPGQAPAGLFAGTVDVAWGGPMRVMQMYEEPARLRSGLLWRGGDPRSVSADRQRAASRFHSGRPLWQTRGDRQRGADTLALPAG